MSIPIPGYLIAVVAGALTEKKVGTRSWVITEDDPDFLEKAATEFSNLDQAISEMEKYTGVPYAWGPYKIVFLPPNFPYGGMENPTLTFATPFLIVGDKSQFTVAVHEIAHSWTGNLVTNMNWDNFWLNEGMTVFLERKVSKILKSDAFVKMDARVGNNSMYQAMLNYGITNKFTSLTP